ncbi:MAG: M23 family metallopeptidase [Candidatus Omnitrophota bacterium]
MFFFSSTIIKRLGLLLVLVLIYPASLFLFDTFLAIKEQGFISPIKTEGQIPIRADVFGDGSFGARRSNGTRQHKGIDIKAPVGEPVLASKSGIAETGCVEGGMGKYVKIRHRNNYITVYGHLSEISVKNNRWVWQGAKIGEVGKTGNANYKRMQEHLHFEIRHENKQLDPLNFLQKERQAKN